MSAKILVPSKLSTIGEESESQLDSETDFEPEEVPELNEDDGILEPKGEAMYEGDPEPNLINEVSSSLRCVTRILMSRSSLLRNALYHFPPLKDPGIEEAFTYVEPELVYDDIGCEKYRNICKDLGIFPMSRVLKYLPTTVLNLKFYGLTENQIRALMETLKINRHVEELTLQNTVFSVEASTMLGSMLEENSSIRTLNLKECRIGVEGASKINDALHTSTFLKEIDLSFNGLGDDGLLALQPGLCGNASIKKLNLSHNNLTENSGATLETILMENKCLEDLNLSWNGFYTAPGNKKLFNGMKQSETLKALNMAWNGIGTRTAMRPILNYVKKSEILEHLDLSSNRLVGPSLKMARTAIWKCPSLISVKIGNNIYTPDEAYFLASVLNLKINDPIKLLDMENMYVNKNFVPLINKMKNIGKIIKIGGVLSNYEILGPDVNKLLFERCKYLSMKAKRKKAKKDFGHFVLSLKDDPMSKSDFEKALKAFKVAKVFKDKDLVNELEKRFLNKKKNIECTDMKDAFMNIYPDATPLPPKTKKKKGGKKGKKGKKGNKDTQTTTQETKTADGEQPQAEAPGEGNDVQETRSKMLVDVKSSKSIPLDTKEKSSAGFSKTVVNSKPSKVAVEEKLPSRIEIAEKKSNLLMKGRESKVAMEGKTSRSSAYEIQERENAAKSSKIGSQIKVKQSKSSLEGKPSKFQVKSSKSIV